MALTGRAALLTVGFPPTETRDRVTIINYPTDAEQPYATVRDENGETLTVHKSRVHLPGGDR